MPVYYFQCPSCLFITENQVKNQSEDNVFDVEVGGSGSYIGDKVSSKMALPLDLSASVDEVKVIQSDQNLSNFDENVLNLVKNDKKVLVIAHFSEALNLVKKKIPKDNFIVHVHNEANEKEAGDWISGESDKKYLIADHYTVAGFEFETVIIVTRENYKDQISSLCQRATAKLIVCTINSIY